MASRSSADALGDIRFERKELQDFTSTLGSIEQTIATAHEKRQEVFEGMFDAQLKHASQVESAIKMKHGMHDMLIADWSGDLTLEYNARGGVLPAEFESVRIRIVQAEARVTELVKKVDDEFGTLKKTLESFKANQPLPEGVIALLHQNEAMILTQDAQWLKLDEDLEKLWTEANDITLSSKDLKSEQLRNYQLAHQFFTDLINGSSVFKTLSHEVRREVALRALRGDREYFEKNYGQYFPYYDATTVRSNQQLVLALQKFITKSLWLPLVEQIELKQADGSRFDAAQSRCIKEGKRLIYPQEIFAIIVHAIESNDIAYLDIVKDMRRNYEWVNVAIKRDGDHVIVWQDPAIVWDDKKKEYVAPQGASGGKPYRVPVHNTKSGFYNLSSIPELGILLYAESYETAKKNNGGIYLVDSTDTRWWPVGRSSVGSIIWRLVAGGSDGSGSRWVGGVPQKNFQ